MDAYSISYTSPSRRNSSRIYQDLNSIRLHSGIGLESDQLLSILDGIGKPRIQHGDHKPHVGVVGAGIAGLRCADILLQHGFRVTVVEGRNRLGGRVHQEKLPNGHLIDVGPNWIHGTNDNPMLDLAKKSGTLVGSWDTRSFVVDEKGELLPLEEGEKYAGFMWEIVQEAFKYSNKKSAEIPPNESLHDFFARKVVEKFPKSTPGFEKHRHIVMQTAELWGAFVGGPLTRQSLKFFWLEECIEGDNLFCAGTFQKILEEIARPAVEGAAIKYDAVATKLRTKGDDNDTVQLTVTGGEALEFDEVVLTAPLGWLKKHLDAFDPPLPARLSKAIDSIGYGCLEKVYISFPKAFWQMPDAEGRIVQGFCQWLSPSYALDTNPARWTQEVVELASLPAPASHPTLLFYIYGDESDHVTSALASLSDSKEKQDAFIFSFFAPYYSRLPHYDPESSDCQPTAAFATSWLQDPLAGNGSYSNFQVGLEIGDEDIRVMREGLPNRGLWLAGEHTAPFVALGTATGAYWSGENVGRRLAEAYGRGKGGKAVGHPVSDLP